MPKGLNKDDSVRHTKVDREKPMRPQPSAKDYGQLTKAGDYRKGLLQGRAHQLVTQSQALA